MTSIFTSYLEITRARKTNLGQILHLLHVFLYSQRVKTETRSRCLNQASGWRSEVRLPDRKEIFLFYKTSSPRCLLLNRYKCSFLGVKRPGREFTTHIHPSSAEVKNEWSCTSNPPTCLHGVHSVEGILLNVQTRKPRSLLNYKVERI
jgi:hypothetical protein